MLSALGCPLLRGCAPVRGERSSSQSRASSSAAFKRTAADRNRMQGCSCASEHTVNCARPIFTVPLTGYLSCCLLAHCRVCGNATAAAELLFGGEGRGKRNIAVPNVASLTYRGAWQPARLHAKSCRREFGQNSQMSERMGEKAGTFSELACVS